MIEGGTNYHEIGCLGMLAIAMGSNSIDFEIITGIMTDSGCAVYFE